MVNRPEKYGKSVGFFHRGGQSIPVRPSPLKESLSRVSVFEDLRRVNFNVGNGEYPHQEFRGRIMEFQNGSWVIHDHLGTDRFESSGYEEKGLQVVREALQPVANLLRIQLTGDIVASNTPQTLLALHSTFIEKRVVIDGQVRKADGTIVNIERAISTYRLEDGTEVDIIDQDAIVSYSVDS